MLLRISHFFVTSLFVSAALLQLNDPDPGYWILAYLCAASVSIAAALNRSNRFWTGICLGVAVGGIVWSLPGFVSYLSADNMGSIFDNMDSTEYAEESREFLGLVLIAVALFLYVRKDPKER